LAFCFEIKLLRTLSISFADIALDETAFEDGKFLDLGIGGGGVIEGNDLIVFALLLLFAVFFASKYWYFVCLCNCYDV
jgi:hypothetical protein